MLLMEALCLDALLIKVVNPQPTHENQRKERDRCRAAITDWRDRCSLRVGNLSKNSQAAFLYALKDGTLIGLAR